jgi:hypothetical protein
VDDRRLTTPDVRLMTGGVTPATLPIGTTETASRHSPGSRVRLTLIGATLPPADGGVLVSFRTFTCQTALRPPVRRRRSSCGSAVASRPSSSCLLIGQTGRAPEKEIAPPGNRCAGGATRVARSLGPNRTLTASASPPSHLQPDFCDRTCCPAVARPPRSTYGASRYDPR